MAQEERIRCAVRQLDLAIEDKGEEVAVREARKQIALYFKGFRGCAALRAKVSAANSRGDVLSAFSVIAED